MNNGEMILLAIKVRFWCRVLFKLAIVVGLAVIAYRIA